jgi:hypothetical protein
MSHQRSSLNGDNDQIVLSSFELRHVWGYPSHIQEQYFSGSPNLYSWTDSAALDLSEGRSTEDLAQRRESTIPRHISSDSPLELDQVDPERYPFAPPIHRPGCVPSMRHGGLTDCPARDERTQVNSPALLANSSGEEIQEYIPRRPAQYQLGNPENRTRRYSQPQTMPHSAGTNASGRRPNREHLEFENGSLIPDDSRHPATVVQPDFATHSSPGSTNESSLLAGVTSNPSPPSLQGLQNVRTQRRLSRRRATALRPARRRSPPAEIVRYTTLSASDLANASDPECPICQDSYDGDQHIAIKLLTTPCAHVFGLSCLQEWVNSGMNNAHRCPTCRQSIASALSAPLVRPRENREREWEEDIVRVREGLARAQESLRDQRARLTVTIRQLQAELGVGRY